ncbi:MAG: hypothetical protein QOI07_2147 [Verrucomicrobiota bacterium]
MAKLGQARVDLAGGIRRAALPDQTPASRDKVGEGSGAFGVGRSSHASSVNPGPVSLKHKILE